MQRARFRIRTIMIAIAAFAVLLVLLKSLTQPFFDNMIAFTAAVILIVSATVALLVVVIRFLAIAIVDVIRFLAIAIVDVFAIAAGLWRGRTQRRPFKRNANVQIGRPMPARSGEADEV
jgi:hypothetical protein